MLMFSRVRVVWLAFALLICLFYDEVAQPVHAKRSSNKIKKKETTPITERTLIIGGEKAVSGDYPYFVHYSSPGCGGSLIAPDIVLTAAHCQLDRFSQYGTLYVGRHDPRRDRAEGFSVVAQRIHPKFDGEVCCGKADENWFYGVHNDFMLLKLSGESSIAPIRLNTSTMRPSRGEELHVVGFGDIDPGRGYRAADTLHEVTVNYMSNAECLQNSIYTSNLLTSASMCASDYREDACSGDSGGPLIAKGGTDTDDVLMGVTSWGWDCAVEPGVYARVSSGYSWIRQEVCRLSNNPPSNFRCPTSPSPQPINPPTQPPSHRPTSNPSMTPSSTPTNSPSQEPTFQTTLNPSRRPTSRPSNSPSTSTPTISPSVVPSQFPSTEPTFLPTSQPSDRPTMGGVVGLQLDSKKTTIPNVLPKFDTINNNDNDEGKTQHTLVPSIKRSLLPQGKSCVSASVSPIVCCASISNRNDGTLGEPCLPAILPDVMGHKRASFDGGMPCEAANWIETNDPAHFNSQVCEGLMSFTSNSNATSTTTPTIAAPSMTFETVDVLSTQSEGTEATMITNIQSEMSTRSFLPPGMKCSDVKHRDNCCHFLDNGGERNGSIYTGDYYGQPCVPVHPSFALNLPKEDNLFAKNNDAWVIDPDDVCQPANLVASISPGRGMDCSRLLSNDNYGHNGNNGHNNSNTTMTTALSLEKVIQDIQREMIQDQIPIQARRSNLEPSSRCKDIYDPVACCLAREIAEEESKDLNPSKLQHNHNHRHCEISQFHSQSNNQVPPLICQRSPSSQGNATLTSLSSPSASPSASSSLSSCDVLLEKNIRNRITIDDCALVASPRACCSAMDAKGHVCVPVVAMMMTNKSPDSKCVPMDWALRHFSNTSLLECPNK